MADKPKFDPNRPYQIASADPKPKFDPNKYAADAGVEHTNTPNFTTDNGPEEPSNWRKALDYTIRGLDYPGGIVRTGIAEGAQSIPGVNEMVHEGDWDKALHGQAPHSSEYMERAGVPAGDVVKYPLVGDVSTRDLGGVAADIVTDPLTALSRAGKLGANVLDQGAEVAGRKMFKSGLKKVDQAVIEKGAKPFSEVALENGLVGTNKQIAKQSEQLLNETKAGRDSMHQAADTAGAVVDPEVAFRQALDKAVSLGERDPGMKDLADKLKDKIQVYIDHGPVPVSQASEWKTNLYNALPDSAYDKFGKIKGPADKIQKSMANGLKTAIEDSGNSVVPGLGDQIGLANEQMQTLLTARKPLRRATRAAEGINGVTSVDAMLTAGTAAASHNPMVTAGVLAAKKAADLSKTTGFRTIGGTALNAAGETGGITPMATRSLIQSPWQKMGGDDGR